VALAAGEGTPDAAPPSADHRRLHGTAAVVAVVTVTDAVYLLAPAVIGAPVFLLVTIVSLGCLLVGPLARRAEPRRAWAFGAAAGFLFLVGLSLRLLGEHRPDTWIASPDLFSMLGYVCVGNWLAGLVRERRHRIAGSVWLDASVVATACALACWVLAIGPLLGSDTWNLFTVVLGAVFPVPDVILLTMTVHLARSGPRRGSAMNAALIGMGCLLAGDVFYLADMQGRLRQESQPLGNALFVAAYVSMAYVATHPHLLWRPGPEPEPATDGSPAGGPGLSRAAHPLVLLAMTTPAMLPVLSANHGPLDRAVRGALLLAMCVLIYLRLATARSAVRAAEAQARFRALHDGLTALPNRTAVLQEIDQRLRSGLEGFSPWVSVLLVDCDRFKNVNDTWGHRAGDAVLVETAARLGRAVHPEDVLARVGGDEFVVLAEAVSGHGAMHDATATAQRVLQALRAPMVLDGGREVVLGASIGISTGRCGSGRTAEDLVRDADIALHEAKDAGRGRWSLFDEPMGARVSDRLLLAEAVRQALQRDEVHAAFQPIHSGEGFGELIGWEALCRWTHPGRGQVSPVDFIPVAEDTGVIVEIGAWMLHESCRRLAGWRATTGRDDLHVSVNVSPVQMRRTDLPGLVHAVLAESGLPADALWLELTESMMIDRSRELVDMLGALRAIGVTLCMDDFGTGYSSLSYLADLPLDIIKIDRSFVQRLGAAQGGPQPSAVVKAIIDLAAALGLRGVVAEGVETTEQAQALAALGCDMAQGWLLGRPMPAEQVLVGAPAGGLVPSPRSAGAVKG